MKSWTRIARALSLCVALVAGGCPPQRDLEDVGRPKPVQPAAQLPTASAGDVGKTPSSVQSTAPETGPVAGATQSEPQTPVTSATPKPTAYDHLAGGIFVPRCASCGTVQPEKSTQCPACGQVLRPWRQEQLCTVCVGSGGCERCGDDRPCLDCDGLGACPFCDGGGKAAAGKRSECNGSGRCIACAGDGRRESFNHDFGSFETALPGVCPTCLGGSGLCPECGTLTKDRAGGQCLTCGGLGICNDCGGMGLCPHDAGDGLCLVCTGGGREVVDGEPAKRESRVWTLRRVSGTPFTGRVLARPDPNVHVQLAQGGNAAPIGCTRASLAPLTYYLAMRDWTSPTDGKGRLDLATVALSSGYWKVAQTEFRRAMAADPMLSSEATAQLRDIDERRILEWLDAADKARKAGDRDGAMLLLGLVRFAARGTPSATRADVVSIQLEREREEEEKGLDAAAKERLATEAKARAERAATGARARIDRARKLFAAARELPVGDPGVDRCFARADEAVYAAQRLVQKGVHRDPASIVPWPTKPEEILREARLLRAELAVAQAGRQIAGGRYDYGRRLALRAQHLDAGNSTAPKLVEQAELGLARRGVVWGSPPLTPK